VETIGSKRSYALTWCMPNNDDDDHIEYFKTTNSPYPLSATSPAVVCVPVEVQDDTVPATRTCSVVLDPVECQSTPAAAMSVPAGPALAGISGLSEESVIFPERNTIPHC